MQLVLFDVDGTLIDSQAVIHECMRRTFVAFGQAEPSKDAVRAIIGLSLDHAIARLLGAGPDDVGALTGHYKETWMAIQAEPGFASPFFPGMRELLDDLSGRDEIVLGIVTGKSRRGVAGLVAAHGLDRVFMTMRTADDCPSKPHPGMVFECCAETGIDPSRTTVIGDTGYDMEMARSAGARAIGVDWGYHPAEELTAAGAVLVARTAGDLLALLAAEPSTWSPDARAS